MDVERLTVDVLWVLIYVFKTGNVVKGTPWTRCKSFSRGYFFKLGLHYQFYSNWRSVASSIGLCDMGSIF